MNDKWLRVLFVALPSVLFLFNFFTGTSPSARANGVYIITTVLVCEAARWLIVRSRLWFHEPYRKAKRLAVLLPLGIVITSMLFLISKACRNYIAYGVIDSALNPGVFTLEVHHQRLGVGLIASSIVYGIVTFLLLLACYELLYHFARLRHVERERDRLAREKLQAELQQLKGIVNPHFLFNNLNSLSSLISEDPPQAEAFLDELTKVFRYLLRTNELELTTLAQELEFMNSYYHLLQTRYGKAIRLEVRVAEAVEKHLLPPLTLQLLIENAVKHNRAHKEKPLCIELFSDAGNRLVVRNNLMLREQRLESTGIGLRSINSRYNLLNYEPLTVQQEGGFFSVFIPLIPSL